MPGPGELPAQQPAPIIGRDAGLARLRALVDPVPPAGQVLLVTGEAGMGKSELLTDAAGRARSAGLRVLSVTGRESDRWLMCVRTVVTDTDSSRAISGADRFVGR